MPKFFATCSRGLSPALESELKSYDLKLKAMFVKDSGVGFECSWEKAYEINLRSKVASRVLMPVLDYKASSEQQIVHGLKKHKFSKYLPQGGTFSLRVKIHQQAQYRDQRFVMNEVRVGLLEQFEAEGRGDIRVSTEQPDLEIFVGVYGVQFSYSLNLSGAPLSNRGYRLEGERAPLRESLAAGLLRLANWKKEEPLVDFFCGSGTFLIEAATQEVLNGAHYKRRYSFQDWANFDPAVFRELKAKLQKNDEKLEIYGFDQDPRSIQSVSTNLRELKLHDKIQLKQIALKDLSMAELGIKPGVVILNPPYGERLGNFDEALEVYKRLGEVLKSKFSGWKAFVLSPDPQLSKAIGMRSFYKTTVDNGGIDCAFLGYEIN
jgi:putative N6-adenine-specific DNA methylase